MKDMTIDEMISVLNAYKSKKEIQFYNRVSHKWEDVGPDYPPLWAFDTDVYRVKPPVDCLEDYRKAYKSSGKTLYPHEDVIILCDIVEPDNEDVVSREFIFGIPSHWLIDWLDRRSGKRCWSHDKMLQWANEEYTSLDADDIFWDAVKDNKVMIYEEDDYVNRSC